MMGFLKKLQTLAVVTLVTVVFWVYAEGREVITSAPFEIPIRIETPGRQELIVEQERELDSVRITLKGTLSQMSPVQRRLREQGGIRIRLGADGEDVKLGVQELNLIELISRSTAMADRAINVVSVRPAKLSINVDELVPRRVKVEYTPTEVELAQPATIDPPELELRLPKQFLDRLSASPDAMFVEAEPLVSLKELPRGVEQTVQARVVLPPIMVDEGHVSVEQQTVQMTFVVKKIQESLTQASVPVWVVGPPSEFSRFRVTLDEESRVLKDVKISGPSDLIQQVRNRDIPVIATFRLTADELLKASSRDLSTAPIKFDLPPELVVESSVNTVSFSVSEVPAP